VTKRPKRPRKPDPLLNADATYEDRLCYAALGPFDRLGREMEDKWGIDRLPELVSTDTAFRSGKLMADLNDAINAADPEKVAKLAEIGIRALHKMDKEAKAAGHTPNPDFWEMEHEGFKFAILRDMRQWPEMKKQRPDLVIFSESEIAIAMKAFGEVGIIEATKKAFPGAEIVRVSKPMKITNTELEDEIPF